MSSKPPRVPAPAKVTEQDRAAAVRLICRTVPDPRHARTIIAALGLEEK
ncbi:hypothetical protein RVR_8259 [Actinacidiphila reveromycinica]|uniref:Uncharacterized protein n=1 Tax=Actinacidiphila reveromycinica TaxID=659352 RepID=A0A7U3UYN9_9ACTN|nr:hypothetical protein [Streptomyces sp. SN-593]BBB01027.1 hypothetical protein RVR_8259 [Streptomyces sp. SN-593]